MKDKKRETDTARGTGAQGSGVWEAGRRVLGWLSSEFTGLGFGSHGEEWRYYRT